MDEPVVDENSVSTKKAQPSFGEAAYYWVKLGFTSFGGPAGQIAMMQSECVDKRGWIGQGEFLRGLNYAMLLPGPEAQQLAAYIGWRIVCRHLIHRTGNGVYDDPCVGRRVSRRQHAGKSTV